MLRKNTIIKKFRKKYKNEYFQKKDVSTYAKHLRENEERRVIKAEHKIQKKENIKSRKKKTKNKGRFTLYEGITCSVKCYDNLKIKDFMIFDNKAYYYTKESDDNKQLDITSSQWLDPDTGFSLVIGEEK